MQKCLKYLTKVSAFLSKVNDKVLWKECLPFNGPLHHITFVYGDGHSFFALFSTFLSKLINDYIQHHVWKPVMESLQWWQAILGKSCSSHSLTSRCPMDPDAWVDASMDRVIGVVIGQKWAAWRLIPGWDEEGRIIGWARCTVLYLEVLILIKQGFINCPVTV